MPLYQRKIGNVCESFLLKVVLFSSLVVVHSKMKVVYVVELHIFFQCGGTRDRK